MDQATIDQLTTINRTFYQIVDTFFHESRQKPWRGWNRVLAATAGERGQDHPYSMLDLGCGNGRWGSFFFDQTGHTDTTYAGVDENRALLYHAGRALLPRAKVLTLHQQEIQTFLAKSVRTTIATSTPTYELIVLFGVWHHLPGSENRATIISQLAQLLVPTGTLVISCWRFLRSDTLKNRTLDTTIDEYKHLQLEEGDYLLDWRQGASAVRYCHDTPRSEIVAQARQAGLHTIDAFSADGKDGNLNDYYLFRREQLLADHDRRV